MTKDDSLSSGVTVEAKLDRAIGYLARIGYLAGSACPPGTWNGARWGGDCNACGAYKDVRPCVNAWLASDEAKEFGSEEAPK